MSPMISVAAPRRLNLCFPKIASLMTVISRSIRLTLTALRGQRRLVIPWLIHLTLTLRLLQARLLSSRMCLSPRPLCQRSLRQATSTKTLRLRQPRPQLGSLLQAVGTTTLRPRQPRPQLGSLLQAVGTMTRKPPRYGILLRFLRLPIIPRSK